MRKIIYVFMTSLVLCAGSANAAPHHLTHSKAKSIHVNTTKVNLNTADVEQLSSLKGIGLSKAKAIVEYRKQKGKFKSLNDLQGVRGIGTKFIQQLLKNNPGRIFNKTN